LCDAWLEARNYREGVSSLPDQNSSEGYECSECFETFEEDIRMRNGTEWAKCVCNRWIHIDCISQTAIDEVGEESKFCGVARAVLAIIVYACVIFIYILV